MDRITGSSVIDLGGGRRGFRGRNAAAGVQGTEVTADWLNAVQEEILAVMAAGGQVPTGGDWTQMAKAIFAPRSPITLAPAGGGTQPTIFAGDHGRTFERDVAAHGGIALPALADTPLGSLFTVAFTGAPVTQPPPAVTVSGGGNLVLRGAANAALQTLGRGEVLAFQRVGVGYRVSILADAAPCTLAATDFSTDVLVGPLAFQRVPPLRTVTGEGFQCFGFDGSRFTAPVTGTYSILFGVQFAASGGAGAAGIVISGSPYNGVQNSGSYAYGSMVDGETLRMQAPFQAVLTQGAAMEFDITLINSTTLVRPQDIGVNITYVGR